MCVSGAMRWLASFMDPPNRFPVCNGQRRLPGWHEQIGIARLPEGSFDFQSAPRIAGERTRALDRSSQSADKTSHRVVGFVEDSEKRESGLVDGSARSPCFTSDPGYHLTPCDRASPIRTDQVECALRNPLPSPVRKNTIGNVSPRREATCEVGADPPALFAFFRLLEQALIGSIEGVRPCSSPEVIGPSTVASVLGPPAEPFRHLAVFHRQVVGSIPQRQGADRTKRHPSDRPINSPIRSQRTGAGG